MENKKIYELKELYDLVNLLGIYMANLYEENENEDYRQALRDISLELCQYLEPRGIPLNRTPLTVDWLDSNTRKEYRRDGLIK